MKQWIYGILVVGLLAIGAVTPVHAASTNNFVITEYVADYYLGRDADRRSTLKTVERITADFPHSNQNHGLERALPTTYDGHPTSLRIDSVTDGQGGRLQYSTSTNGEMLVLRIGDKDTYVHGLSTYQITYTQRDVTRYFADTASDEFYWDVNGTQWRVPIQKLSATVHLGDGLAGALSKNLACYEGTVGSADRCTIKQNDTGITAKPIGELSSGKNVTIAMGFGGKTFTAYQQSASEKLFAQLLQWWIIGLVASAIAAVGIGIWAGVTWVRRHNRGTDIGAIVPEYLPPSDASVLVSASVIDANAKAFSAQLIDFAVRHYVKIYQTAEKKTFSAAEYELELVKSISDLRSEEQALLAILFPGRTIGDRFAMAKLTKDYALSAQIRQAAHINLKGEYGMRLADKPASRSFRRVAWWALAASIVTLSPFLFVTAIVVFVLAATLRPLTDKGVALKRYTLGLKLYIKVAEADRLKMLQSPDGAEKTGVTLDGDRSAELVRLYERVLPYAVLLNQETEWNKRLGAYYESANQQPDWYVGSGPFNAAVLGSALTSFSNAATYAASSSSSSGGSSGGGFSGGGGGGGGGGGW